jgi:hypothetical protein
LSDTATDPSIIPNVVADANDRTHVTWQERVHGRYAIFYTFGWVGYWSIPERVSGDGVDAFVPSEAVGPGSAVYVGWDEGTQAVYRQTEGNDGDWSQPKTVLQDPSGVTELVLAMDVSGQFHAVWSNRVAEDNWDVFYQRLSSRLVLPVIIKTY